MNKHQYAVIMAGGIGSRFWPMSRQNFPKQFLDILNTGKTLIQATYERFTDFIRPENIYVVTSTRIHGYCRKTITASAGRKYSGRAFTKKYCTLYRLYFF